MNIQKERLKCLIIEVRSVLVSTVVSYSLAYDATDVMDNHNLVTALEPQIQISIVLIGMVRKPSVEPIISTKW